MKETEPPALEPEQHRVRSVGLAKLVACGAAVLGLTLWVYCSHPSRSSAGSAADSPENVSSLPPSLFPEEDHSLMERSMALIIEGKMEEADALFREKLTSNPFSADVHCYKGAVFAHNNQSGKAITEFDQAILFNPRFEIAYNDRGNEYDKRHEYDKAIADYSRAMLCGYRAVHWSNRANVYVKTKQYAKAVADATTAINRYNVDPFAFHVRAQAWMGLNKLDNALADINSALLMSKDDPIYLSCRGDIYFEECQPGLARADFSRVIALDPKDANAYFWRGRCNRLLNEFEQARADFLIYKRLDPSNTVADGWIADLDDFQYDLDHKPSSLARQWAIACSALMFTKNGEGSCSLPGQIPSPENQAREKELLSKWWGVTSRESLLAQLSSLKSHGHNSLWHMYLQMLDRQGALEQIGALAEAGGDATLVQNRLNVVREYGPEFGDRGILAWDLGRYICLCRWGSKVGYISEEEAYKLMIPEAIRLQEAYGSWKQMGEEYLIGRKFWNEPLWKKDQSRYEEITRQLLNCKTSPWVYLPWRTKLG